MMLESTLTDFLAHLTASHLLTDERLTTVREESVDSSPADVAIQLITDGLLTRWQARMLFSGRDNFFLGKYKLLDHIGQGGMGAVLKAEQQPIGRIVAIKVISEMRAKDANALARFRREIQAAAALNHPNVVVAYDADEVNGVHFLVMEYVAGEDLGVVAKRQGRLPVGEACEYMRQAAEGLHHAHERGMVHRDIKPSNLLLTVRDGTPVVKILDMGLARFTESNADTDEMTQTGQIMGTPDYISPEQARNTKDADIRSDIYSLGCSLFRLVAGKVPFEGANTIEKIMARTLSEAPRVSSVLPNVPPEFEAVLAKMLARDPANRYQTASEVATALMTFATQPTYDETIVIATETILEVLEPDVSLDPVLDRFLQGVALDAGLAERSETVTERLAPPTPVSAARKIIDERRQTERRRLFRVFSGLALAVFLIIAFFVWEKLGETMIVLDWSLDDRNGATLVVDGADQPVGQRKTLQFTGGVGQRTIVLKRPGFEPIERSWDFQRGQTKTFAPTWKPTATMRRELDWLELEQNVDVIVQHAGESGLPQNFAKILDLKRRVDAQRGVPRSRTPEILRRVAKLVTRLPLPADALRRDEIPMYELEVAGNGDPADAPPELVAVLGNSRLSHWSTSLGDLTFSPTEDVLASSGGRTIRLWDPQSGDQIGFHEVQGTVLSLDFSPDGKLIAYGLLGDIHLWDIKADEYLRSFLGEGVLNDLDFHPGGETIAAGYQNGDIRLWDLKTGVSRQTLQGHAAGVRAVSFTPDGNTLISAAQDGKVLSWDLTRDAKPRTLLAQKSSIHDLAISSDGAVVAAVDLASKCRLIDVVSGKERRVLELTWKAGSHNEAIFLNGDKWLATVAGTQVQIWDVATGREITRFDVPGRGTSNMSLNRDGTMLATSNEGSIRRWRTKDWTMLPEPSPKMTTVAVDPSGTLLAAGRRDGPIDLYDLTARRTVATLPELVSNVRVLAFGPEGRFVASANYGSLGRSLRLWDVPKRRVSITYIERPGGGTSVTSLAFDPSATRLAFTFYSSANTGRDLLQVWRTDRSERLLGIDTTKLGFVQVSFGPDGRLLYSSNKRHHDPNSNGLSIWDTDTGKERCIIRGRASYFAISPDGTTLVEAANTGRLQFWDAKTGLKKYATNVVVSSTSPLEYSPDGSLLVGQIRDQIIVVNVRRRYVERTISVVSFGVIKEIAFTPDGRHLVTANGNGTIYVLRLQEWSTDLGMREIGNC